MAHPDNAMGFRFIKGDDMTAYHKNILPAIQSRQDALLLLAALLFVVLTNGPLFSGHWLPPHDSLYRYETFHYFYNAFLQDGELPLWIAHGAYGQPASYAQWAGLSPLAYFTGALGWLAGAQDTLFLFHVSNLLDVWVYVLGLVVVGGRLYHRFWIKAAVVAGALLGHFWWFQPYFQLYQIYGWPLVYYFLLRFSEEGQVRDLLYAGLIMVLSLVGNTPYIGPLYFWMGVIFVVFSVREWPVVRRALPALGRRENLLPLLLLLLVTGLLAHFALGTLAHVENVSQGRDMVTHQVPLDTFLNYGRYGFSTLAAMLASGAFPHEDLGFYMGLALPFVVGIGLFRCRHRHFLAFAAVGLFLFWLSLGGVFAMVVYHWPGMGYFRHLSYLYPAIRLAFLLAAGVWLQEWLAVADNQGRTGRGRLAAALLLAGMALDMWVGRTRHEALDWPRDVLLLDLSWQGALLSRLAVYLFGLWLARGLLRQQRRLLAGQLLVAVFLLDLGLFHWQGWMQAPLQQAPLPASLFQAEATVFQPRRLVQQADFANFSPRSRQIFQLLAGDSPQTLKYHHALAYGWTGVDPCQPLLRSELFSANVLRMIRARGGQPGQYPTATFFPADDPGFLTLMGCESDKLQWFHHSQWARDKGEAVALLHALPDPSRVVVLEESPQAPRLTWPAPATPVSAHIRVRSFSANHLTLQVRLAGSSPAWLLYADAWHVDWRARVDSQPVAVYPAQVGFKAIAIPPGEHQVVWQLLPSVQGREGGVLALLGLLAGVGLLSGSGGVILRRQKIQSAS